MQLLTVPDWVTKTHTIQDCRQSIKFSKQQTRSVGIESTKLLISCRVSNDLLQIRVKLYLCNKISTMIHQHHVLVHLRIRRNCQCLRKCRSHRNNSLYIISSNHLSTVLSVARDPTNSTSNQRQQIWCSNFKPSHPGYLTDEQKASKDNVTQQLQGGYRFDMIQAKQTSRYGWCLTDFEAMPAIIVPAFQVLMSFDDIGTLTNMVFDHVGTNWG
jgi:hypothetical protein